MAVAQQIGNPPQLWKSYEALGRLHERKEETAQARCGYVKAIQVIDETGGRLQDQRSKQTFLSARQADDIRGRLLAFQS